MCASCGSLGASRPSPGLSRGNKSTGCCPAHPTLTCFTKIEVSYRKCFEEIALWLLKSLNTPGQDKACSRLPVLLEQPPARVLWLNELKILGTLGTLQHFTIDKGYMLFSQV